MCQIPALTLTRVIKTLQLGSGILINLDSPVKRAAIFQHFEIRFVNMSYSTPERSVKYAQTD